MAFVYDFLKTNRSANVHYLVETDVGLFLDSLVLDKDTLAQKFLQRAEFPRGMITVATATGSNRGYDDHKLVTASDTSAFRTTDTNEVLATITVLNQAGTAIYGTNLLKDGTHWLNDNLNSDLAYFATAGKFYEVKRSTSQLVRSGTWDVDGEGFNLTTASGSMYYSNTNVAIVGQSNDYVYVAVNAVLFRNDSHNLNYPHSIVHFRWNKTLGVLEQLNNTSVASATNNLFKLHRKLATFGSRVYYYIAGRNSELFAQSFDMSTGTGFAAPTGLTSSFSAVALTGYETTYCSEWISGLSCFYVPTWTSNVNEVLNIRKVVLNLGGNSGSVTTCTLANIVASTLTCKKESYRVVPALSHMDIAGANYLILSRTAGTKQPDVDPVAFEPYNKLTIFRIDPADSNNLIFKSDVVLGSELCYDVHFLSADRTKIATLHSGLIKLWSWNSLTETFNLINTLAVGTYKEAMVDSLYRLWVLDSSEKLHVFTPELPNTVTVAFQAASYDYTGTNISTNLLVNVRDINGVRQIADVQLFIDTTNAQFGGAGVRLTSTTTLNSGDTIVPITITGAGQVRIKANIVQ